MIKVLFFGDIIGRPGREAIKIIMPKLVKKHKPDFVIANVENMAHGKGTTLSTIQDIEQAGVFHAYTSGNHYMANAGVLDIVKNDSIALVRPMNYPSSIPGVGYRVVTSGAKQMLVMNFLGRIFMKDSEILTNPFVDVERVLADYTIDKKEVGKQYVDAIFIDFHGEVTAEKRNFGFLVDGRASVVVGTHTHVPTADEQVLLGGTAYISDVGMVGPLHSSLGLEKEHLIQEMILDERQKREVSSVPDIEVGAVVISIKANGLSSKIERIREIVSLE